MEHQIHFNRKFYQDKKTGYWISCDYPRIRAHRWVWISNHGKIPPGYHIHHKDENRSNNEISNLELIEASRHLSAHMTPEKRERSRQWAAEIRPLTKAWHASEEGRAWHKAHGILGWINKKPIKLKCKVCRKEYETKTYHQDFCSNNCKSQWRRDSGIDNESRVCETCKKEYIVNKYSRQKYCTRLCGWGITEQHYKKAFELRKEAYTYQEIAEELNICRSTVSKILKSNPNCHN